MDFQTIRTAFNDAYVALYMDSEMTKERLEIELVYLKCRFIGWKGLLTHFKAATDTELKLVQNLKKCIEEVDMSQFGPRKSAWDSVQEMESFFGQFKTLSLEEVVALYGGKPEDWRKYPKSLGSKKFAWVHKDARVAPTVKLGSYVVVGPYVVLKDNVSVSGVVIIAGDVEMSGDVDVLGNPFVPSKIFGGTFRGWFYLNQSDFYGSPEISGAPRIERCQISGHVKITDSPKIVHSSLFDQVKVSGGLIENSQIGGSVEVSDTAEVKNSTLCGDLKVSGSTILATCTLRCDGEINEGVQIGITAYAQDELKFAINGDTSKVAGFFKSLPQTGVVAVNPETEFTHE